MLEPGTYTYYVGTDVRSAEPVCSREIPELQIVSQCSEALAPVTAFDRLRPGLAKQQTNPESAAIYEMAWEPVPLQTIRPSEKRNQNLPEELTQTGDQGYRLSDVADGTVSMETFVAQISDKGLCEMVRGEGMCSPKVTPGIAGAYGGVTKELQELGIPVAGCADGPSGIRMDCGTHAFAMPNGTCLAATFNAPLCEELYQWEGMELRRNKVDALLGPGMNIHRNPLNGRNFEYFSEDPHLTGKLAAAQLRGMHRYDVTGVIKHFAGNTQEFNRHSCDSIVSERALREIYLKGFEIAMKEGGARAVMSTYGPVNGIWTASSYDLLTAILRDEWGFTGIVMTDWWAKGNDEAGAPGQLSNVAAQVRAQNDLNMVNGDAARNSNRDNLDEALADGRLSRAELQRTAANICRYLLTTPAYARSVGIVTDLDKELEASLSEEDAQLQSIVTVQVDAADIALDVSLIDTHKAASTVLTISQTRRCLYELELEIRAVADSPLAQIPLTVYQDKMVAGAVTLTGADKDWQTVRFTLQPPFMFNFFLKFYFGQSGMEIRSAKLLVKADLEDRFLEAMQGRD